MMALPSVGAGSKPNQLRTPLEFDNCKPEVSEENNLQSYLLPVLIPAVELENSEAHLSLRVLICRRC